ncbi:MAG: hypothetical protein L3J49_00450 [Desulfobulbaceae bacterium]|nr:hypothetical protein [Desulfobulbaceae bacterium]
MKKKQERLDKVMVACRERMQEEVSALLGKTMTFAEPQTKVLSKEDFFSEPAGKSVLAHIKLDGDLEGDGCLIVTVRDAIRIGGTLIMLPDSELETVIAEEEYSEELEDSYGEIANILCGSLTATFEEQFPKSFRLVRTEQEVILPAKVDAESDEPIANGSYYLMTSAMTLGENEMGTLQLLLPAESFGLVEEPVVHEEEHQEEKSREPSASDDSAAETPQSAGPGVSEEGDGESIAPEQAKVEDEKEESTKSAKSPEDIKKQKKRIDQLLETCLTRAGEEVGALLGGTLAIEPKENGVFSKEELLEQAGGKQVMARLEVRGDGEGQSYLFMSMKDAIYLGGTMIMLPDTELDEVVRNEEFGEDAEDAYGEIANIIAGVYTAVFEEQYRKNIGFVKTGLETIVPIKIDPDSDDVIPSDIYYLSTGEMSFNGQQLGRIQAVFPAELFELESLAQPEVPAEPDVEESAAVGKSSAGTDGDTSSARAIRSADSEQGAETSGGWKVSGQSESESADILVFTDDDVEAESIAGMLARDGYSPRVLHYRDPAGNYLSPAVSLVFLVMKEVNEQGFGMAIKLSSAGIQVPLIASGPAWTRTTVLKAVKYGASDILITPATAEDVREKLEANLAKKAA